MRPVSENTTAALVEALAAATAECTALMNEQFLALIAKDSDTSRFDEKIAAAIGKRELAMNALLNHVQIFGW